MLTLISDLQEEIEFQNSQLLNSFKEDKRIALLEVTRCIDDIFCLTSFYLKNNSQNERFFNLFKLFMKGWNNCLLNFIDTKTNEQEFNSNHVNTNYIQWANECLYQSGMIGQCKALIDLYLTKIIEFEKINESQYKFIFLTPFIGFEAIERNNFELYQKIRFSTQYYRGFKKIQGFLNRSVKIGKNNVLKCEFIPDIFKFYYKNGQYYSQALFGYDAFSDDACFDLLKYKECKQVVSYLIGSVLMHRDVCYTAIKKFPNQNPWYYLTQIKEFKNFTVDISNKTQLEVGKVKQIVDLLTINNENKEMLTKVAGNAPPPIIKISKLKVLISMAGFLSNPFSFLNNVLYVKCQRDYFRNINYREEYFRSEFLELFRGSNILFKEKSINIKNGNKLLTDIDVVLYSPLENMILLVQLKWYDTFAHSMQKRKSMSLNINEESSKWINKIDKWLSKTGKIELKNRFDIKQTDEIDIALMILSRNSAFFSDYTPDNRAIWASWYQIIRLCTDFPNIKHNLKEFIQKVSEDSPLKKEKFKPQSGIFEFGKYTFYSSF